MKYYPLSYFLLLTSLLLALPGCNESEGHPREHHGEHHKIVATRPVVKQVFNTEKYVCQIHSCRHIEVCALEGGYLEQIPVQEGQTVRQGELLFKIVPTLFQAKLESEQAEAQQALIEFNNTKKLYEQRVVSESEVALAKAKLLKAQAKLNLAKAELNFTSIRAPFSGIIDRLHEQLGSLIEEGDVLTTLSDNSVMWVYFNVPEARYIEYQTDVNKDKHKLDIELVLANGKTFNQKGTLGAIEADFNNETGNIAFRADFPNPSGLLRHGQTGSVLLHRKLEGAVVIPQRATFEILDKRFVFVVDKDNKVHQREIGVQHELEDIYVIEQGITAEDTIILEGVRQVQDGEEVEYEFRDPEEVLANLKYKAE